MKEKEILEMNEIKEKFAEELEMQVCKEMGLPTTPLSQLPHPMLDIHHHDLPTCVTPSSLLSIKREKLEIADLTDPPPPNKYYSWRQMERYWICLTSTAHQMFCHKTRLAADIHTFKKSREIFMYSTIFSM